MQEFFFPDFKVLRNVLTFTSIANKWHYGYMIALHVCVCVGGVGERKENGGIEIIVFQKIK